MLKGNLEIFSMQVCGVVSSAFRDAYTTTGENVDRQLIVLNQQISNGLSRFINQVDVDKVTGRVNKGELRKHVQDKFFGLMLFLTPNLKQLCSRRTTQFVKSYKRRMVELYRLWETKNDNPKPRSRREKRA